jgi:ribose transport system substrate-binding protein
MNPDFDSIAVANHPGVSPTGLRIAYNMLMGKKVDESKLGGANGLSFVLPVAAVITSENLDEGLAMCEGKPDAFLLDDILTDDEVQAYFK